MPQSNGEPVWIVPHDDLGYILLQSLRSTGISEAMSYELVKHLPEVVQELRLTCANCGAELTSPAQQLGQKIT